MGIFQKPELLLKNSDLDKEKWLEMRLSHINSTEAATLFDLNKYQSYFEMWHEKRRREIVNFGDNDRMKAGRFLEPSIAKLALDEIECNGSPFKQYLAQKEFRLASSFDWKITSGKFNKWLMEVKNVDKWIYQKEWQDDIPPDHIEMQVQHQLAVSQRPGTILAVLVGGNDLKLIPREYDEKIAESIAQESMHFWQTLEEGKEPEPDFSRDSKYIIKMLDKDGGEPYECHKNGELWRLLEKDNEFAEQEKFAKEQREHIKAAAFMIVGDACRIMCEGKKLKQLTRTKDTAGTLVTEEMVGQIIGGRKGYRQFR